MKLKNIAIVVLSATVAAGAVTYLSNKKEYKSSFGNELYTEAKVTQEKYRKLKGEGKTLDDFTSQPEKEISSLEQKLDSENLPTHNNALQLDIDNDSIYGADSENLLTHDNAVQLDIDNDGIKETISLKYEADSEYLEIIKAQNTYICYEKPCTSLLFELIRKKGDYIFRIGESVSSSSGPNCHFDEDIDGYAYVPEDEMLFKYRYQDEFIWEEDKLIPIHKWTIQIASVSHRRHAVSYVKEFLNRDYDVYVQSAVIDDRKWNRIFLGSYKTKDEAQIALGKLKKKHPNSKAFIKSKELVTCERLK